MEELNFGRMLARAPMFGNELALHDLGNGHTSTYLEHLDRVGHLCAVMRDLGVQPGDRVGVLAGASHLYVELWRACLAGAGVITPLNNRLADDELVYILNDSATEVVFVDATFAPVLASVRERLPGLRQVVLIGDDTGPCDVRLDDLLAATASGPLPPEPDGAAAAALLYTGGTTG
ncbi:MAG: AMP-binding protein, partial [Actinomycetota bacterium]